MIRLAIFASGSGSNAENIVRHFAEDDDIHVALILSNRPDAFVLDRAKKLNVPAMIFTNQDLKFSDIVLNKLIDFQVDWIILAGFLLKVPQNILKEFDSRIINIHPALLPKYGGKGMYGMHVHNAVIAAGEMESGITIHLVNENYDEGKIVFQARTKITASDTPESLAGKIHELEYLHFPLIIEKLLTKELN